eukprot:350120-Chlamydomonas_euryale.AAC.3
MPVEAVARAAGEAVAGVAAAMAAEAAQQQQNVQQSEHHMLAAQLALAATHLRLPCSPVSCSWPRTISSKGGRLFSRCPRSSVRPRRPDSWTCWHLPCRRFHSRVLCMIMYHSSVRSTFVSHQNLSQMMGSTRYDRTGCSVEVPFGRRRAEEGAGVIRKLRLSESELQEADPTRVVTARTARYHNNDGIFVGCCGGGPASPHGESKIDVVFSVEP